MYRKGTYICSAGILLLLAAGSPEAHACGGPIAGEEVSTIYGWTADDRYFVYEYIETSGDEYEGEIVEHHVAVFDTRTQETEHWSRQPKKKRLNAWMAKNPLSQNKALESCGAVRLHVELQDTAGYTETPAKGSWKKREFQFTAGVQSQVIYGVKKDGRLWQHGELNQAGGFWGWWSWRIEPSWSPSCTYIAWILKNVTSDSSSAAGAFGEKPHGPVQVHPVGPLVHIMAHDNAKAAVDPVLAALTKAGFAPHVGPAALKDRDKSVIYAWDAVRKTAERIAAAVPGGATVEPLSWPTPADVIVAVGRSAKK